MRNHLHRERRRLFGLAAALALIGTVASALAEEPAEKTGGWYVGAAHDESSVEVWRDLGWEVSPQTSATNVRGGLRVSKHFAVDVGLLHTADLEWHEALAEVPDVPDAFTSDTTFDATALQVAAVGIAPFAHVWEAHVKGGLALSRLSGQQTLIGLWSDEPLLSRPVSGSNTGILFGFGLGVTVAPGWHLSAEFQTFAIDERFLGVANGNDATMDSFAFGVEYRFGQRQGSK